MNTHETARSFGGNNSHRVCVETGMVYSLEDQPVNGKTVRVVAVWRHDIQDGPVYAMGTNVLCSKPEHLLGCAVVCLNHLGVKRPRVGSIMSVARMLATMVIGETMAYQYLRDTLTA